MLPPFDNYKSAIRHYRAGELDQAEHLLRDVVESMPQNDEAWHVLGLIACQRQDWLTAVARLQRAVSLNPANAAWLSNLGFSQLSLQQVQEATESLERSVRLAPDFPPARYNLGLVYQTARRLDEAEAQYRRVTALQPENAGAWNNLGLVLSDLGRPGDAVDSFNQALKLCPDYVAALSNLGLALHALRRFEDARQYFLKARHLAPDDPSVLNNLGLTLCQLHMTRDALSCFRQAIELKPDYGDAYHNKGCAHLADVELEKAADAFKEALRLNPQRDDSAVQLGVIEAHRGQFNDAVKHFRRALQRNSSCAAAFYQLSMLQDDAVNDQGVERLRELSNNTDIADDDRLLAHFALANILDRRNEFDEAFVNYAAGNALKRVRFDPDRHAAHIDRMIESFSREAVTTGGRFRAAVERQFVFIIGMPRSGTTLVEQIISRHPDAFCCGELAVVSQLAQEIPRLQDDDRDWSESLSALDDDALQQLRDRFLSSCPSDAANHSHIVDKTPGNFLYLGLIASLFPDCRIIHCRRHALDTALSCFFCNFDNQPWSFTLEHIAAWYRGYARLMRHWEQQLPLAMTTIAYEDLVTNQEAASRQILDGSGLTWDDRCLEFRRSDRVVATSSKWQVRQPIHARSVGRWRHYRDHLGPLMDALGIHEP